jgi:hypothetical protein
MDTNSTKTITKDNIAIVVNPLVRCRAAYIMNKDCIDPYFSKAFSVTSPHTEGKQFIIFTCCEEQKKIIEEKMDEVIKICNSMNEKQEPLIISNQTQEEDHTPRTMH